MDGVLPDCETEAGCLIPDLHPAAARLMDIRGLLEALKESVGAETVCRLCEVDRDDLELLAVIEREIAECRAKAKEADNGEGH